MRRIFWVLIIWLGFWIGINYNQVKAYYYLIKLAAQRENYYQQEKVSPVLIGDDYRVSTFKLASNGGLLLPVFIKNDGGKMIEISQELNSEILVVPNDEYNNESFEYQITSRLIYKK